MTRRTFHRPRLLVLAAGVLLGASTLAPTGAQADACPDFAGPALLTDIPEGTDVVACSLIGTALSGDGAHLEIPAPGHAVSVAAEYADGSSSSATVSVDPLGILTYPAGTSDKEALLPASSVGGPQACTDDAYSDKDEKMYYQWLWYLGDGARPDGMSTTLVIDRLKDAADNITASYNDCSYSDQVSASASYQGVSTRESQLTASNGEHRCAGSGDGRSVVDFGNLDDNGNPPLAVECTWSETRLFADNQITESDIRFNTTNFDWTNNPGSCVNKFDLEAVATHEFGHTFGLGHVSETDHGRLTMSTQTAPCDGSPRTLGKGDILSLRNTY